ncbi:hypothetical protein QFZ68_006679 [Streptomyces sp. V1I6]|nr:hypothetical protein [Streptomyces sp. V1I6]
MRAAEGPAALGRCRVARVGALGLYIALEELTEQ